MTTQRFVVTGTPRPQGSKSFVRGRIVEASKYVSKWRRDVASAASHVYSEPTESPVTVELVFTFSRPKSHVKSDGSLRNGFSEHHIQRPDVDKLSRAILDALTGIAYRDDSQVVSLSAVKRWGEGDGVEVVTSTIL